MKATPDETTQQLLEAAINTLAWLTSEDDFDRPTYEETVKTLQTAISKAETLYPRG